MQAGAAVSASPFDTGASTSLQQHHQTYRSASLSSGSVVTIQRPGSLSRIRSQSPDDSALIPLRLARDPMSQDRKRRKSVAIDPSEHHSNDLSGGIGTINRWSHSTSSSIASNSRRNRSSSGAVLSSLVGSFSPRQRPLTALEASPRASPPRHRNVTSLSDSSSGSPQTSRRMSRAEHQYASLTALPPLHTTPSLTDPNDNESPSTTQTIQTPSAYDDYFDGDDALAPYGMAKTQRVVMIRNPSAPMTTTHHTRAAGSYSQETANNIAPSAARVEKETMTTSGSERSDHNRRPRARERERTEKDKKTMLSKALQKANTAVLLDNAQNCEGALEAYGDACELLMQVMERTSGEEDKRKLDAIRVTYSNRMDELYLLVQERPPTTDEKNLPTRPMSEDSVSMRSLATTVVSPIDGSVRESAFVATPRARTPNDVPRLSYPRNDRDSFFQRTMEAVESSTSFTSESQDSFSQDSVIAGAQQQEDGPEYDQQRTTSIHLPPPEHSQYIPRPLSPRRPQSPKLQPQAEDDWQRESVDQQGDAAGGQTGAQDSTSWLDTIDESADSCSDSEVSFHDEQGRRIKHLRGESGGTDPDFDAAFDAAVEAAYDEGLEPDLEARRKRMTALQSAHAPTDSIQVPASEIDEILPAAFQANASIINPESDDPEEERILDEITHDYGGGFNFDLQSKSALPRQSDSSGYSRSTWQSSQMSDRATAATSLSTVAEDGLSHRFSRSTDVAPITTRARGESTALPPPTAPPKSALPRPPSADNNRQSVRSRRLSGLNSKQLKIETSPQPPEIRKRASTFHHNASPFAEEEELKNVSAKQEEFGQNLQPTSSDTQHGNIHPSPPSLEFHSALDEMSRSMDETAEYRPSYEEAPSDMPSSRPTLFRKNKSSVSLREHTEHTVLLASPDMDHGPSLSTPMSSTFMSFAAKRNQIPLASQRANLPSFGQLQYEGQQAGGGMYLFDTTLNSTEPPVSPRSPNLSPLPSGLEPCPEPFLLRPFWLMRALSQTIIHPRGGFVTTKMFVPREVWQTRGVKIKLMEDKISNCDLLTAALGRLAGVDTYDADAVMEELQSFEEVMERVQASLAKKLGSEVGVHGVTGMFKDASAATGATAMGNAAGSDNALPEKAAKTNSGKSYLTSWRKLRNKSSGVPLSTNASQTSAKPTEKEQHTMPSVPMTSFVPVERRGNKKEARNLVFEGPQREYMGSLARLFDGVQVLDQIARQVEDPGLKHSSPTHVGLELSIRHAAEFFGFYICRFVLADLGQLIDKFVKRGTEWVLA